MASVEAARRRIDALVDRAATFGLHRLERLSERHHFDAPICESPLGSQAEYLTVWERARRERYPAVDAYEQACGAAIDREWFDQLALLTQVTIKPSPVCYAHGRVLYAALTRYIRNHRAQHLNIVETGTARGFSAVCMAKALADVGAAGKIATFDVLPHETAIYWNTIRDADGRRTRAELLGDYSELIERHVVFHRGDTARALRAVVFPRVHLAFLDSVHTYEHVTAEFAAIGARQRRGDLAVFDDYNAYAGVTQAADEICAKYGYAGTMVAAAPGRAYLVAERR